MNYHTITLHTIRIRAGRVCMKTVFCAEGDLPSLVSLGLLRHPKRLGVCELVVSVGTFKLLLIGQAAQ
jgi:hypothetical protein